MSASFLTVPQTVAVARTVFVHAWSMVVNRSAGAGLILGIQMLAAAAWDAAHHGRPAGWSPVSSMQLQ